MKATVKAFMYSLVCRNIQNAFNTSMKWSRDSLSRKYQWKNSETSV